MADLIDLKDEALRRNPGKTYSGACAGDMVLQIYGPQCAQGYMGKNEHLEFDLEKNVDHIK